MDEYTTLNKIKQYADISESEGYVGNSRLSFILCLSIHLFIHPFAYSVKIIAKF